MKILKNCIFFIVILTILLLINTIKPISTTVENETYPLQEVIVIGGDNYFPPFEYVDENGIYRGFNVDLINAIAIEMGINIELRPMTWHNAVFALQSGEIDAIQGMKYSETREIMYYFSDAYLISSQAIFVHIDNKYIVNLEDLIGKNVAIQKNDIAIDLLSEIPDINLVQTDNQELALSKLYHEEVDAYVGNRLTGLYIAQKSNYRHKVKIIGEEINPEKYSFVTSKENEKLIEVFNEGLERIKKKGTYDIIYSKWFGQPINPTYEYARKILGISVAILIFSFFAIYMFYKWNDLLKREVEKRTDELKREATIKEQTLNSIIIGLITLDNEGRILYINQKGMSYLNAMEENLIGKHFKDTPIKNYIQGSYFYEVINNARARKNIEKEININNEKKIFQYSIYPITISKKEIYGATITFADVTKEKMLKEKIIIKDKLESLGRLTAGIAHEIRNPLTSIKAYVELIPEKYNSKDFREKISVDVPKEIRRLNDIINSLLDYAKPKMPQRESCNVKEVMEDVVRFFSNEARKNNVKIKICVEESLHIFVDKQQFKQIIINLLLNALQATEEVEEPRIEIKLKSRGNFVYVNISDNGHGIAPENIDKIFEPFFSTKKQGTGLGLALSYQFVKENEGDVFINSKVGLGTTITIKFKTLNQS